jgi:hypothetical protein
MSKSDSGRVVIDIDPQLKRELHGYLALEGKTLKNWFIESAEEYLNDKNKKREIRNAKN